MPYLGDTWLSPSEYRRLSYSYEQEDPDRALREVLDPEGQTLLRSLASAGGSGLSAAANVLDLPGSMVRDVLSLQNPLDQLISPFSAENRTTGRQMLRNLGMAGPRNTWGNFATGLALETAIDPLTYIMPFGALTKAGKAARSVGLLDELPDITKELGRTGGKRLGRMTTTLDEALTARPQFRDPIRQAMGDSFERALSQPLGGNFGFGFIDPVGAMSLPGRAGTNLARFLDYTGEAIRYSPPVKRLAQAFQPEMMGRGSEGMQRAMPGVSRTLTKADAEALGPIADVIEDPRVIDYFDHDAIMREMSVGGQVPEAIEGYKKINQRAFDFMDYVENAPGATLANAPEPVRRLGQIYRTSMDRLLKDSQEAGVNLSKLEDLYADYYYARFRKRFPEEGAFGFGKRGKISVKDPHAKQRLPFLRGAPGRTRVFQEMSVDPEISGWAHKHSESVARGRTNNPIQAIGNAVDSVVGEGPFRAGKVGLNNDELEGLLKYVKEKYGPRLQAPVGPFGHELSGLTEANMKDLTRWMAELDPRHAEQAIPAFETNPLIGLTNRLQVGRKVIAVNQEMTKQIADRVVPQGAFRPGRGRNVEDMLKEVHGQKTVPPRARQNLVELLKDNEHYQAAVAEGAKEHAKAARIAQLTAGDDAAQIVSGTAKSFEKLHGQLDDVIKDVSQKQDMLVNFGAQQRVAQVLDEILEMDPAAFASGDFERLLAAVDEVKPDAIRGTVMADFKETIGELVRPILERTAASPDDVVQQLKASGAIDQIFGAAKAVRRQLTKQLEAATPQNLLREVRGRRLPDELLPDEEILWKPEDLALAGEPRGREPRVVPSVMDRIRTIFEKGDVTAEKGLLKGSRKFKRELPLESGSNDALIQAERMLTDIDSFEELDINAFSQLLKGNLDNLQQSTSKSIKGAADTVVESMTQGDALSKVFLPEDEAADIIGILQGHMNPKAVQPLWDIFDSVLQHWKSSVTRPWPAFHTRNLVSGHVQSFLARMWSADDFKIGMDLARGRTEIKGLAKAIPEFARLTDAQATSALRREMFQHSVVHAQHGTHAGLGPVVPSLIGSVQPWPLGRGSPLPAGTTLGQRMNPLSQQFEPFRLGGDVGNFVEAWNRATPYVNLRKKGWSPEQAARRVGDVQVDYRRMAAADPAMKRVMPFWMFSSRVLPETLNQLLEAPGGRLGQALRTINRSRDPQELTPDYVAETASIPLTGALGSNVPGTQRYLTGLGLMFEDPFSFLGGGVRGGLLEAGSRLNPAIKAPLEWMTGQSFFQKGPMGGRPLGDLDPTVGRTLSNIQQLSQQPSAFLTGGVGDRPKPVPTPDWAEFALGNLPTARLLTSLRTATDPRKGAGSRLANLMTGLRVSDVSPASQDAIIREQAQEAMKRLGAKSFQKVYIPKDEMEKMPPAQRAAAEQFNDLMSLLAERAKLRKLARQ